MLYILSRFLNNWLLITQNWLSIYKKKKTKNITSTMDAVEFPSHRHPLNRKELLSGEETQLCGLCGKEVINGPAYECSKCNFTAHLDCVKNPPSLVIEKSKIHEHTLTLLPRHVSFTCNACGRSGNKSPYVCLKCSFMVHGDCINIPLVIKISRHLQGRSG